MYKRKTKIIKAGIVGPPTVQVLRTVRASTGPTDKSVCFSYHQDKSQTREEFDKNIIRRVQYEFTSDWLNSKVKSAKAKILTYLEDIWWASGVVPGLHCEAWYIGQTHNPQQRFAQHRKVWQATALVCIGRTNHVYAANAVERSLILEGRRLSYNGYKNKQVYRNISVDKKRVNDTKTVYFYIAFKGQGIPEFLRSQGVQEVYC